MQEKTRVPSPRGARRVRGRFAFTLVELLVVVAIIALLVSILLPSLSSVRELARRVICQTNLRNIGTAWELYFHDYDNKPGSLFHPHDEMLWSDTLSQWNDQIWCAHWSIGDGGYYSNAGRLWKAGMLDQPGVFVCPSMERPSGQWFNQQRWAWRHTCPRAWNAQLANFWPPKPGKYSYMSYGRRRMNYYDDRSMSARPGGDRSDDKLMLSYTGTDAVEKPTSFSWMADSFVTPEAVLESHVPGVNVLYLDGHVRYWEDETGEVLYDNGLPNWVWKVSGPGAEYNWKHDDTWMIIDGYHLPPVGSGEKGGGW